MIPLSIEYAIREAVALLRASQRNFKSRQVEEAGYTPVLSKEVPP